MRQREKKNAGVKKLVYPQNAFLVYFQISDGRGSIAFYPALYLCLSSLMIAEFGKEIRKETEEKFGYWVKEEIVSIQVQFSHLLPMEDIKLKDLNIHYNAQMRSKMFMPVMFYPQLYKLLVLPRLQNSRIYFDAVVPLLITTDEKIIHNFLYQGKIINLNSVSHAAIYTMSKSQHLSWHDFDLVAKQIDTVVGKKEKERSR